MPTSSDKPKPSLWGKEQWLPQSATAIAAAIGLAVFAVLMGWWDGLSKALLLALSPQLLIDTVGVLFLLVLVLSYSLYRKVKVSNITPPQVEKITTPATEELAQPPKPKTDRLNEFQERLLIEAANRSVFDDTLTKLFGMHPEESKYYFDSISAYMDYKYANQKLNSRGRAYLVKHGLMPDQKK